MHLFFDIIYIESREVVMVKKREDSGSPLMAIVLILLIGGLAFVALNFNKVMNYIETGNFEEPGDVVPVDNDNQNNSENNNNNNNNNNNQEQNKEENKEEPKKEENNSQEENNNNNEETHPTEEEIRSILWLLPLDKVFLDNNGEEENGYSGVHDRDTTFYVSPGSSSIKIDQYFTFNVIRSKDISTEEIRWECSDTRIASNEGNGKFKGLKAGTVTISAYLPDNKKATATLHIINQGLPMSTSSSIVIGDKAEIAVDEQYKGKVKFVSSNPKIASVDNNGKITAYRTGTVTFTGTYGNLMNSVTLTVPIKQKGAEGTFAPKTFPAIANSAGLDLAFYNVCGGIVLTITRDDIRAITLTGNNDEIIAGTIRVDFEDGLPAIKEIVTGEKSITFRSPNNKPFIPGTKYFITAIPGTFSQGFKLKFIAANGDEGLKNISDSKTINRSRFLVVNDADANVSFAPNENNANIIHFVDLDLKDKLVAAFDKDGDGDLSYDEAAAVESADDIFSAFGDEKGFQFFNEFH